MTQVCVVDANGCFLAAVDRDAYALQEGQRFVETAPPVLRPAAGYPGMVKPVWKGEGWTEGAAFPELLRWEVTHRNAAVGKTLWETIEEAYTKGVNSAYDQ